MSAPTIRSPIVQHAFVVADLDDAIRHWIEVMGTGPFFVSKNHVGRDLTYRGEPNQTPVHYAFGQSGPTQVQLIAQDDPGRVSSRLSSVARGRPKASSPGTRTVGADHA